MFIVFSQFDILIQDPFLYYYKIFTFRIVRDEAIIYRKYKKLTYIFIFVHQDYYNDYVSNNI